VPTFAEVLQENGFSTVAVVSAWPLKNESCGLKRGFLHYDEKFQNAYGVWHTQQFGDVTADKAIAWLKGNYAGRFFLWVHFFDPHQPYRLNPGFTEFKELKKEGLDGLYKTKPRWKPVIDSYDSEVKFVDFQVGRIIQALERLNLLEKTLVILTSDHGESLGENDYNGHGRFLYESSVRVPLVIRFPGKEHSGRSVKREVSIMDVMPTVLDFLGIPPVQVPVGNTGVSLIPLLKGGEDSMVPGRVVEFEVYRGKVGRFPRLLSRFWYQRSDAELPRRLGMRRNGWKLIYTPGKKTEIFYLPDDPAECANLYKSNEALATGMREELVAMFSESSGSERSKEVKKMKMDRETREKLKSLGYTR
jgi:arylsulfatase A-like enzyme